MSSRQPERKVERLMTFRFYMPGWLTIGLVLMGCLVSQVGAQERLSESQWKRGFQGLVLISDAAGLKQVSLPQFNRLPAKSTVMVVLGDWNRAPAIESMLARGGSVLAASDQIDASTAQLPGRIRCQFDSNARASNESDAFAGMADCPIVRDLRPHPALDGIRAIATNRPGVLSAGMSTIAYLPPLETSSVANGFIAAVESESGGRLLAVADQSIFTNQMIAYKDNDLFAYQALKWLKANHCENVLFVVNGEPLATLDPTDVELAIPPPSRKEVMDALGNLPPSAVLDFANSVASVIEDENMVNEFIQENMDKVSPVQFNRFLLFLFFGMICLTCLVAFIWQKKLMRQTATVIATQRSSRERKDRKSHEQFERQWAAGVLLDSICMELADRRYNDWPGFPIGLDWEEDDESKQIFDSMTQSSNLYKTKSASYWTRKRLLDLEQEVLGWRAYFHRRMTQADDVVGEEVLDATPVAWP